MQKHFDIVGEQLEIMEKEFQKKTSEKNQEI